MNKRIPFISLLVAIEIGLDQVTFGTASIFTSFLALVTLRRKDFLIYLLVSSPAVIVSYVQYGAFWVTAPTSTQAYLLHVVFEAILHPWYTYLAIFGVFSLLSVSMIRTALTMNHVNKFRHHFNLKEKLYPEIKFVHRIRRPRRDFGDKLVLFIRVFSLIIPLILACVLVQMYFTFQKLAPVIHEYFNCYQLENNSTLTANMTTMYLQEMEQILNC